MQFYCLLPYWFLYKCRTPYMYAKISLPSTPTLQTHRLMCLVSHCGQTHQLQWQVSDWFLIGICCVLWFLRVPGSKSATPSRWQHLDGSLPVEADGTASTPTSHCVRSSFGNCCLRTEYRAEGSSECKCMTRTPFYGTEIDLALDGTSPLYPHSLNLGVRM